MVEGFSFIDNHIFCGGSSVFFCFFQFCEVGGLAYGLNRAIYKPFFHQVVNLGAIFQKHSLVQSTNPPRVTIFAWANRCILFKDLLQPCQGIIVP